MRHFQFTRGLTECLLQCKLAVRIRLRNQSLLRLQHEDRFALFTEKGSGAVLRGK